VAEMLIESGSYEDCPTEQLPTPERLHVMIENDYLMTVAVEHTLWSDHEGAVPVFRLFEITPEHVREIRPPFKLLEPDRSGDN